MAEVARLATAGGARISLARVTEQAFLELSLALERRGVTKLVAADMVGVAPRTYHRRLVQAREAQVERRTLSAAVLELVRASGSVSAHTAQQHFLRQPPELLSGALNDLVHSGLARRTGWGDKAVYRALAVPSHADEVGLRCSEPVGQVRVAGQRG